MRPRRCNTLNRSCSFLLRAKWVAKIWTRDVHAQACYMSTTRECGDSCLSCSPHSCHYLPLECVRPLLTSNVQTAPLRPLAADQFGIIQVLMCTQDKLVADYTINIRVVQRNAANVSTIGILNACDTWTSSAGFSVIPSASSMLRTWRSA